MTRAWWLSLVLLGATQPAIAVAQSTGSDERARAVHVLNRLTFGPRPGDVERVLATGIDRWIEQQLSRSISEAYDAAYPGCAAWVAPFDNIGEASATMVRTGFSTAIVMRGSTSAPMTVSMRPRASGLFLDRLPNAPLQRTESVQLMTCRLMRMERSE